MASEPGTGMREPIYETRSGLLRFLAACLPGRHLAGALFTGFALRLFFILQYPTETTDYRLYDQLARNWLHHGIYGVWMDGRLVPVDVRAPGYPAFLAAIYAFAGTNPMWVMLVQAIVDLATCMLITFLAVLLIGGRAEPNASRPAARRAVILALWLAALCPFTANYTAVPLTETIAIFLTALILVVVVTALATMEYGASASRRPTGDSSSHKPGAVETPALHKSWFFAGLITGVATLVRPETPFLLGVVGLVLLVCWWRPRHWGKLLRAGLLLAAGLALPLLPWAARNWHTLGEVQFLAPRYAQLPGEQAPAGFYQWVRTWQIGYSEADMIVWKLENEPLSVSDVPASAFDSEQERRRVAALLDLHNEDLKLTAEMDRGFQQLAAERAHHHPFRTWLWLPFRRAITMWFTPRIELLPYTGQVFPLAKEWDEDREDLVWTLSLWLANLAYLGLAAVGAWKFRYSLPALFLMAFALGRTLFFTRMDAPEPRYLLVCFPAVIALAALAFVKEWDADKRRSTQI